MKLLPIKRIDKEDLQESPAWIDRLLAPINQVFNSLYVGLNKGITFQENIRSQIKNVELVAKASASDNAFKFRSELPVKPTFLICTHAETIIGDRVPVTVNWNYDGTYINITSITGLTNGATYTMDMLIL